MGKKIQQALREGPGAYLDRPDAWILDPEGLFVFVLLLLF
jgi:hypothetical protein